MPRIQICTDSGSPVKTIEVDASVRIDARVVQEIAIAVGRAAEIEWSKAQQASTGD